MGAVPPGEELGGYLGEQSQRENVLVAFGNVPELLPVFGQLRLQKIRRAAGDDLLWRDTGLGPDILVHGAGKFSVLSPEHGLGFFGEGLIPFPGDDIHYRLGAHNLAGGGHQRRVAVVRPHPGNLGQNFIVLILFSSLFELGDEV